MFCIVFIVNNKDYYKATTLVITS